MQTKMLDQIQISALESHLWEAANILRGPVDAADFKTYVFPLLFFKRISDVYDEEYTIALEESGGDEEYASFPQNYRFQIPNGCRWSEVRAVTSNVGTALQKAMRGIEKPTRKRSTAFSAMRSGPTRIGCRIRCSATY
jgi:type I restriction enzyme M protein